ncbi:PIN domain protein [Chitinophaga silvatica]|uniref:PIN domain protein n=1 Tax=Chitinophaga silvatica TaxID=2282649 RepID=A0A3E1Y5R6_9BACT|nr:PIN domain protein [Chitinophaga silvatica]RFS20083.1 PIN domain protein [Chitinophaga silvatica]
MLNIYTDTSVIGGCFDKEFEVYSNALFEEFKSGTSKLILSDVVKAELERAGPNILSKPDEVPTRFKIEIKTTLKAAQLAQAYIEQGALTNKCHNDALHIALATLQNADVLASWNFKHLVNLNRIKMYNSINLQMGYRTIDIRTPREILKPDLP